MPKKIENLRSRLLQHARGVLIEGSGAGLTIRSAAAACGVAVGTVYSVFASKEALVEAVVLEDWDAMIERLRGELLSADGTMDGLEQICRALDAFANRYNAILCIPVNRLEASESFRLRHNIFADSLCTLLEPLLLRFGEIFHPILPLFLAEALLVLATDPEKHFENVKPIFEKLLS